MEDRKLSNLDRATALKSDSLLYIVSDGASKAITGENLFDSIPNTPLNGETHFDPDSQILLAGGEIDITSPLTDLRIDTDHHSITIPKGRPGQIKIILTTQFSGGKFELVGNIVGSSTITFEKKGDAATLVFYGNHWYMTGGTATIS